jgi:hypothetical protein
MTKIDIIKRRYINKNIQVGYKGTKEILDIYELGNVIYFQLAEMRYDVKGDKGWQEVTNEMHTYFHIFRFKFTVCSKEEAQIIHHGE